MGIRKLLSACLAALLVVATGAFVGAPVNASPEQAYDGPYFGDGNFPPGCVRSPSLLTPTNVCHHMKTGMSGLDSPKVDVVILAPVSPTAERDTRIMRQTVEMWEGGLDYLARQMGLGWLADGVDFHVTLDYFDPLGGEGGEFTTYPIVDPEIVLITTNDGPPHGIGIDPVTSGSELADAEMAIVTKFVENTTHRDVPELDFTDEDMVPCHSVQNPFDVEYWENLPGFDSHHDGRSGTYVEDCGGAGGNICFAINNVLDPAPEKTDGILAAFDTIAHEFGHCLTLGHVGDGADGAWGPVPYNDIMAYSGQPSGLNKCVSTLDVEGVAVRMSNYLDVNGDGAVTAADRLMANDQVGINGDKVQVQHPHDHLYASGTGSPVDCPQPDVGLVPGPRTEWTPTPIDTENRAIDLTSPQDGTVSSDGSFDVVGTLEHQTVFGYEPTASSASTDDTAGDADSPYTDVVGLDVEATATELHATMHMADMWPTSSTASPVTYTLWVNGMKIDSYMIAPGAVTAYPPNPTSTWDPATKTVEFHFTYSGMADYGLRSPYYVDATANVGSGNTTYFPDDLVPEPGHRLGVARPGGSAVVTGHVRVYVDGSQTASEDVDTRQGTDTFSLPVSLTGGTHELRVDWEESGEVVATRSVTVTYDPEAPN